MALLAWMLCLGLLWRAVRELFLDGEPEVHRRAQRDKKVGL